MKSRLVTLAALVLTVAVIALLGWRWGSAGPGAGGAASTRAAGAAADPRLPREDPAPRDVGGVRGDPLAGAPRPAPEQVRVSPPGVGEGKVARRIEAGERASPQQRAGGEALASLALLDLDVFYDAPSLARLEDYRDAVFIELRGAYRADLTGDGELDLLDFLEFQNLVAAGDARADLSGDGALDILDVIEFQIDFARASRDEGGPVLARAGVLASADETQVLQEIAVAAAAQAARQADSLITVQMESLGSVLLQMTVAPVESPR